MVNLGEQFRIEVAGQEWLQSWHPPDAVPDGRNHGAAGICVTADGQVVLISGDGTQWDFPAGRPEPGETLEQTLTREMREEACATVLEARLLGFARGFCVKGHEAGLTLVRSFWRAHVAVGPWRPEFEIAHRRLVTAGEVLPLLPKPYLPICERALMEAGLLDQAQVNR